MKSLSQHITESFEHIDESMTSNRIIQDIQRMSLKLEVFHHNTRDFAEHKAFDDIQGAFNSLKDDAIEKLIGYTGDRYNATEIQKIEYSSEMSNQLITDLYALGQSLIGFSKEIGAVDLENIGQEINGLGAKLNYLLTLK